MQIYDKNNGLLLDTLAQLRTSATDAGSGGSKITLLKRARSKYISNGISLKLADLDTDLKQSYYNTYHCASALEQHDNKITGKYCNNRWCLTCNRIRTAKLINGYKQTLSELEDKTFVTLTVPNVSANVLSETLDTMLKTFKDIQEVFRKRRKSPIIGIRKLEVTFNPERCDFHPHFHLVVSGHDIADEIVLEWLKRNETANIKGQDVRQADDNSVMELFKYFTKIVTKKTIYIQALDTIFLAMRNRRVFQPMGIEKNVPEDIESLQAEVIEDLKFREAVWTWIDSDWVNPETGETLTGYEPSENVTKLIKAIK